MKHIEQAIQSHRAQRGKAKWPPRLMARTRVGVRLRTAVSARS